MSRFTSPEVDIMLGDEMTDLRLSPGGNGRSAGRTNTTNPSGGASSSKAVLAALKALQEKIRRLELERTQHLDEVATMKTQLKSQEIEGDHLRQRDNLMNQKTMHELKIINDRIIAEKNELEVHITRLDDKVRELGRTGTASHDVVQQLQNDKESLEIHIRELEASNRMAESQGMRTQQREKGIE
jgi:chromosome segregation ATPase